MDNRSFFNNSALKDYLLNSINDAIIATDLDGTITYWNKAAENLYKWKSEEVIGKRIIDVTPSNTTKEQAQSIMESLAKGEIWKGEFEVQDKNGRVFPIHVSDSPLVDENGNLIGIIGSSRIIENQYNYWNLAKENEDKYRSLYQNAPLPYQSLNEDGSFNDINPTWLSMLGYERDEVIGKYYRDFLHPDWQAHFDKNFLEFKKRGNIKDVEFKLRHKKGHYLDVIFEGRIGYHPDGSFKQSYCVFTSITERKAVEESLRKNQFYLSKAQELGKIGTWELDLVNNILTWTKENYKVFGVQYGTKLNYERFLEIVHPDDRDYVNKEWNIAINNKDPYDIEHRLLVDGEVKWVREKADIKYDSDGNPISAIGFTQDITRFKEVENSIKQEKEKFKILADNTFDWEYWIDPNGKYIYQSPACERITGYKPDEFIKNPKLLFDITIPEYKKQVENHYKTITEKDQHTEEFIIINKNNEEVWIEHSCIPVYDDTGNFRGRRGTNRDITEIKKAEFELTESEKKYRSLFENINQGHALHEVICDDTGKVVDYITLLANDKYEEYLDVSKDKIIGKKASDILPKKELDRWINIFGDLALNGTSKNYNLYSESNKKHFEGIAYCPEKGKFAVSFSDVTEQKHLEEIAKQQSFLLKFINSIAIPSADKSSVDELAKILLKAVKEYTGAILAIFSDYQSDKKELKLLHVEADQKLFRTILKIAGDDVTKITFPVDNNAYNLIVKDIVGEFNSFNEVSFGAIPKLVDKAIRKSTGIDRLFPVAHVIDGDLYGTTMLAFKKGQAHPSTELLESFAHLMSVSLKRYKAEKALKDSESKFRNLFNSMQEGVYLHQMVYDDAGKATNYRIIEANDISEKILNIKKEDAIDQLATDVFKTKEAPFLEVYSKVAETGVPVTFDQYFEPMDKYFLISVFSPKKGQFATAFTDITQQKKNEKEIIKAKEIAEERERKLDQHVKYLESLNNSLIDAVFTVNPANREIKYVNKAVENIFGYAQKDCIGLNTSILYVDEQDYLDFGEKLKEAILNNRDFLKTEIRLKRKSGEIFTAEITTTFIKNSGEITEILSIVRDITEKIQYQNELVKAKEISEESEKRFQLFVNQSPTPIAVVDKKMEQIIYWSHSATLKLGHSPKKVSEWFNVAYPDPDYRKEVIERWTSKVEKAAKSQKATNTGEYEVTRKDGSVITAEFYVQFLPDQVIITLNDITERKIYEDAIKESEENLKSIVENGTNMFYRHDVNHQLKYVSPQIKNILGYEVEEAMVRWTELTTDNPINELGFQYTMKAIETGERQDVYDLELKHKNGSKIQVEVREAPVVKNGKTIEIVGALADVTEKRKTEQALKGKNDEYEILNKELIQINKELQTAKVKAEESDRLKSAFLANMSHEIRTPMNGILGFSNLLKEPHLSGKQQKHYIDIIQKSGERMLNTVNDIIEISKIETGLVTTSTEKVNINKHFSTLYHFFKLEADNKGLKLLVDKQLPEEDCRILVDKSKLSSILTNLIKNAIKFTYEGTISFGCEKKGEMLEFYVKDTGVGVPQNRLEAIFNRFEQADIEDKRVFEGSGLGLTIAKSYTEMLGGKIWVESEEGKGSMFFFTIPAIKPEPPKLDLSKSEKPAVDENKNLVILIAEDDEVSKIHLSLLLENMAHEIIHVSNGSDAVEAIQTNSEINLILMDVRMPKMGGIEATRKIREFNKEIVIIAQTAYALEGDREKMLQEGCTDYISKPINREKLIEIIGKYFN